MSDRITSNNYGDEIVMISQVSMCPIQSQMITDVVWYVYGRAEQHGRRSFSPTSLNQAPP
jgi:hypothetical protein